MTLPGAPATTVGSEHFPHDADVGVRGWGATLSQAFEQAAVALTHIVTDAQVAARDRIDVRCEAPDIELLFVELLNGLPPEAIPAFKLESGRSRPAYGLVGT